MEPLGTNIHMMIIVIVIRSRINIFMISLTVTVGEPDFLQCLLHH